MRWILPFVVVLGFACGGSQSPTKRTSVLSTIASSPAPKSTAPLPVSKTPPRTDPSLLQRRLLFANPDRALPLLSPDGKRISYLSNVDGVLNVWVAPSNELASAKALTQDKKRGIRQYHW